jgi:hypothetical protein
MSDYGDRTETPNGDLQLVQERIGRSGQGLSRPKVLSPRIVPKSLPIAAPRCGEPGLYRVDRPRRNCT